jgi:hypothetical protein
MNFIKSLSIFEQLKQQGKGTISIVQTNSTLHFCCFYKFRDLAGRHMLYWQLKINIQN